MVEIFTAAGYQAAKPAEAHFGLGAATKIARLTVHWPSGKQSESTDVEVDRVLILEEPE